MDGIIESPNQNFGKLSLITTAFQNCYLNSNETNSHFTNLINSAEGDYSRYLFFYLTKLTENKNYDSAIQIASTIDPLTSDLLIAQTKKWIDQSNFKKFNQHFSCKHEADILAEFFFLISNLYSSQGEYEKSIFFLNISNYLNPKLMLLVDEAIDEESKEKLKKNLEKKLNTLIKNELSDLVNLSESKFSNGYIRALCYQLFENNGVIKREIIDEIIRKIPKEEKFITNRAPDGSGYSNHYQGRDTLIDYLADKNIHTSVHFKPLHKYDILTQGRKYPVADTEWLKLISLPCQNRMTEKDIDYVIYWVNKYFDEKYII